MSCKSCKACYMTPDLLISLARHIRKVTDSKSSLNISSNCTVLGKIVI